VLGLSSGRPSTKAAPGPYSCESFVQILVCWLWAPAACGVAALSWTERYGLGRPGFDRFSNLEHRVNLQPAAANYRCRGRI